MTARKQSASCATPITRLCPLPVTTVAHAQRRKTEAEYGGWSLDGNAAMLSSRNALLARPPKIRIALYNPTVGHYEELRVPCGNALTVRLLDWCGRGLCPFGLEIGVTDFKW